MGFKYYMSIEKNEKENPVFVKHRNGNEFLYLVVDNKGNKGWMTKNWVLLNKKDIAGLGVSGTNLYPIKNSSKAVKKNIDTELTPEQVNYFKNSTCRNKQGNLKIVYHATHDKFDIFLENKIKKYPGFWFSENKDYANEHGNIIMSVYLNLRNPFDCDKANVFRLVRDCFNIKERHFDEDYIYTKEFRNYLIKHGYDGIQWTHDGAYTYIAFFPNQIKSINNLRPTEANGINE